MSLQITKQADYAMRALVFIGRLGPGKQAPSNVIAEEMHMSRMFLSRINSQLSNAGLINTRRGARGGIMLAKAPSEISVYDVLVAIDGPVELMHCTQNPDDCTLSDCCPLRSFWLETQEVLIKHMQDTSIQDLLDREAAAKAAKEAIAAA